MNSTRRREGASQRGLLRGVPRLPAHYLERQDRVAGLASLLCGPTSTVGIMNASKRAMSALARKQALHGMGGLGKTVLANAVARAAAHDFEDGVLWLAVGEEPRIDVLYAEMASALGLGSATPSQHQLEEWLADWQLLLVLDDVWSAEHLDKLDVVGERGRLLVTTRDRLVLNHLASVEIHSLDILSGEEALELLGQWTGTEATRLPAEAGQVARACGYLPLALAMIGAMVRADLVQWPVALALVEAADLAEIEQKFPGYPYPDLLRAIEASVRALPADLATLYGDLAVFPEDVAIPAAALQVLWGLPEARARKRVGELAARSLVSREDSPVGERPRAHTTTTGDPDERVKLHDVQRMYVQRKAENLSALHDRLVDAYVGLCQGRRLSSGPDDGYFFERLPYHLACAGRMDELCQLLLDVAWLDTKLRATGPAQLIADYALLDPGHPAHHELLLLRDALLLSSHVLITDPDQLSSQLIGRLRGFEREHTRLARLLAETCQHAAHAWLCPLTPTLTAPGGPLVRTFAGHTDHVTAVAVLPDARRALSASQDSTLRTWDLDTGSALRTFRGHTAGVTTVAVLPGGKLALSGSLDGTLILWYVDSGAIVRRFEGHSDGVCAVAVLPDGQRAVSASHDRTLKTWDLHTGECLATLEGHLYAVTAVAILPDGRRALSASLDRTLILWDLDAGAALATFAGHVDGVKGVAVLPDGERALSASDDRTLMLWHIATGALLRTFHGHASMASVAVLPDGKLALSASDDHTLVLWDLDTGAVLRTLEGHSRWVRAVAVLPDGKLALSGSRDRTLKLWDLATHADHRTRRGHSGGVTALALTRDERFALSASEDHTLRLWDLSTGAAVRVLEGHGDRVRAVALLPDDRRALSASDDTTVKLWDVERGEVIRTFVDHSHPVSAVLVLPDGERALSGSQDGSLVVWDLASGAVLCRVEEHDGAVRAVAVLPDGNLALSAARATILLWDTRTGAVLRRFEGHSDWVRNLVVLPGGEQFLSASCDATLILWDLDSGAAVRTFHGHTRWVTAVALLPDARRALSASDDRTLCLWDLDSGASVRTFHGHTRWVRAAEVLPGGEFAVSASHDCTLAVWNLDTGAILASFAGEHPMTACAYVPGAHLVVAGDSGGYVHALRLWQPGEDIPATARHRKVEELFDRVLDLDSGERERVLDLHCAGNAELRRQVIALLEHAERSTITSAPGVYLPGDLVAGRLLPRTGERFGQYTLMSELGSGGMGVVYLARDETLERLVAIKVLLDADPLLSRRFLNEARATARCSHENIVVVHEVAEHAGCPYMVLEYLRGKTLRQSLHGQSGPLPPGRAISLMLPVARALACAHSLDIIHRDLKPENIMVTESGTIKVLDFGIAKILADGYASTARDRAPEAAGMSITRKGAILGTLPYMSPEQWSGATVDARSDLWAVGIMLHEMVAGHHPLAPLDTRALQLVGDVDVPMPLTTPPGVSTSLVELARLIDHCLTKKKEQRLATAAELVDRLEDILARIA